jgi:hypothetical protein
MRSEAPLAAIVIACAGCPIMDAERPIGVVSDGLSDVDAANLAEAAQCWNLEFGTQFVVGAEGASVEQQVVAFYDKQTCLHAAAQVQTGWPDSLAVCPQKYWGADLQRYGVLSASPFRVLSHEIGHVLNIVGHPDAPYAVMQGGGYTFQPMFDDADRDVFRDANPDFVPASPCQQVTRSVQRGTHGTVGHCACDTGPFDLSRPIAIVPAPEIESLRVADLVAAAGCWNLRYGTTLAVRPAEAGDQVAYLEAIEDGCLLDSRSELSVARDGDEVLLCTLSKHTGTPMYPGSYYPGPMEDVGRLLGVEYTGYSPRPPFTEADDREFAKVYPGRALGCSRIVRDETTGVCSCDVSP